MGTQSLNLSTGNARQILGEIEGRVFIPIAKDLLPLKVPWKESLCV